MVRHFFAFVFMALLAGPGAAAEGDPFERLLFPLVVEQHPGAYGTIWSTEAVVRNEGDVPLDMFTSECDFRCPFSGCLIFFCLPFRATPPHSRFQDDLLKGAIGVVGNPASLLYIPAGTGGQVFASLRLIEESRRANEFGIEIPVIRESELYSATLWLVDVPMPAGGRTHVRFYGVESATGEAQVRVRAYPSTATAATLDEIVTLFYETPKPGDYRPTQPSYSIFLLPPELTTDAQPLRVRVDAITPGLKFWAMASVTGNETQHVTLVTPQ
jgi:hypothetical protein